MPIDFKQYKKSISPPQVWKFILLFALAYFLFTAFTNVINTYLVNEVIAKFPQTVLTDLLCLTFLSYVAKKVWGYYKKNLYPTIASLIFVLFIIVFYLLLLRVNNSYCFYTFQLPKLSWLRYADLLLLLTCTLILDFRAFNIPLQKQGFASLIADEPNPDTISDLIQSESYVKKIALAVNETTGKTAYAIGIFSSWGTGKTDFLLRLKRSLQSNIEENIVLEFNPWKATSAESILEDFFAVLSSGLKPYNKSITAKLKSYSKKILSTGKEIQYRFADAVIDELIKDLTLQERYEHINSAIQQTGKRIVIMIDDLDRLNGMEVMQVLKVIRNSANFANTFFIVALDHGYIVNVLNKTGQFAKEEQYLKKIFQLTVTLPQIRKGTFSNEILNLLTTEDMLIEDKDKIEKAISVLKFDPVPFMAFGPQSAKEEGNLEKMLTNYRDVKRFCNSFKISFGILKDEVDIIDLFLLELIKSKSFYAYELIANKTLLDHAKNEPYNYILNNEGWEYFKKTSDLDDYTLRDINSAISYLLSEHRPRGTRRFLHPHNFYLYFCYQLFALISLQAFQETIKLSPQEMRGKFDEWVRQGRRRDLERILDGYEEYKDKEEFEKFMRAFLLNTGNIDFSGKAKQIIMNVDRNVPAYFGKKEQYAEFVRAILNDDLLPEYNRAYIANELLKHSIYNNRDLLLPKQELQDIIYRLFDRYLQNKQGYDTSVYLFYLFNDDHRDNDHVVLNPKAHQRMFNFLSIPENLEGYLRYLIRSWSLPTDGEFVFAPFTKDIFQDWPTFKDMVQKHSSSDDQIKALQPLILKYTDEYLAGKDRFRLDGDERNFILNHLRNTKQYNF